MGHFPPLWRRAPLWSFSFLFAVLCLSLSVFYPTPWLKKRFPWLPGEDHFVSGTALPGQNSHEPDQGQLLLPDMQASYTDQVAIAGHILPLPKGEWHPVAQAQKEAPDSVNFIALVRIEHSLVTGLITAQFSGQSLPPILADNLLNPCHDDRNYLSSIRNSPGQVNCTFLATALMANDVVSLNPFIHAAITRIREAGLLLPPLMITVGWRHIAPLPGGQVTGATVDILLAPMEKGTTRLLAPIDHWDKEVLSKDRNAMNFINKAKDWLPLWGNLLTEGYNNTLPPSASRGGKYDPASEP